MQPAYAALLAKKKAESLVIKALHDETGLSGKATARAIGVGASMYTNSLDPNKIGTITLDGLFLIKFGLQQLIGNPDASQSQ